MPKLLLSSIAVTLLDGMWICFQLFLESLVLTSVIDLVVLGLVW